MSFFYYLKLAGGSLRSKPSFVLSVVLTIGLVLGALLSVVTLAYVLLVKPLPYPKSDALFKAEYAMVDQTGQTNVSAFSFPAIMHLYENHQLFDEVALVYYAEQTLESSVKLPVINTAFVSQEWFTLLDITMYLGRTFTQSEAIDGTNAVAVISYAMWQNEFNSAPDILSKKLMIAEVSYQIIGVAGANFIEPELTKTGIKTAVWLPWQFNPMTQEAREFWWNRYETTHFIGRLPSTITIPQAEAKLTQLADETWQQHIDKAGFFKGWRIKLNLHTFESVILGSSVKQTYLLVIAVAGIMLIACINIANLFIARTLERKKLLTISVALGAKKRDLFLGLLYESGILIGLSCIVGVTVAHTAFIGFRRFLFNVLPRIAEVKINEFTLSAALFTCLLLTVFFAYLSTNMVNYRRLVAGLQSSGKGGGIQVSKVVRNLMIGSQVAVASILLFLNMVVFKQAVELIDEAHSWQIDQLAEVKITSSTTLQDNDEMRANVLAEFTKQVARLPEVEQVSRTRSPIGENSITWSLIEVATLNQVTPIGKVIDHQYFDMIKQPLIAGQLFNEDHIKNDEDVLIVNDVLAKQLSADGNVLGKRLSFDISQGDKGSMSIIGIVKGVKLPGADTIPPRVFRANTGSDSLLIQFKQGQTLTREQLITQLKQIHSGLNVFSYQPLSYQREKQLFTSYTVAVVSLVLTIVTFVLSALGLYGILNYSSQLRRVEIGTRLAIGAKRFDVIKLVVFDNLKTIVLGLVIGVLFLFTLHLLFPSIAMNYKTLQLLPYLFVTLTIITCLSLISCYLPLRKYLKQPAIYALRGN